MYKKFSEYTPTQSKFGYVMNPQISGIEFKNPYKVKNNDMRVPPLVSFQEYNHSAFKNAYPQLEFKHNQ
jgi:hypothetical protein